VPFLVANFSLQNHKIFGDPDAVSLLRDVTPLEKITNKRKSKWIRTVTIDEYRPGRLMGISIFRERGASAVAVHEKQSFQDEDIK